MTKKGFASILIVGLAFALFALGATFYLKQSQKIPSVNQSAVATQSPVPSPQLSTRTNPETIDSAETANWKLFANQKLGIRFKYPPTWSEEDLSKAQNEDLANGLFVCVIRPASTPYNCYSTMRLEINDIDAVKLTSAQSMGIGEVIGDFGGGQTYPAITEISSIVVDKKSGYKIKGTTRVPYGTDSSGKESYSDIISYNFLIPLANNTLVFGNVSDEEEMTKILSTFIFLD